MTFLHLDIIQNDSNLMTFAQNDLKSFSIFPKDDVFAQNDFVFAQNDFVQNDVHLKLLFLRMTLLENDLFKMTCTK